MTGADWSRSGQRIEPRSQVHSQPLSLATNPRRLEAPVYYAPTAQILISGNDATLLFTRPHPAILQDGNLAPVPLREPVALIQMSIAGLKELSVTLASMVRQIEQQSGEIQIKLTRELDVESDCANAAGLKKH
jgi:hypothetical protein